MAVEAKPVRLRLSRAKGFNLKALSQATNGLDVVKVSRPGPWGNPFSVLPDHPPGKAFGLKRYGSQTWAMPTVEDAVACFAEMMADQDAGPGQRAYEMRLRLPELRGRNLACWCALNAPCHADVLLDLANQETSHVE